MVLETKETLLVGQHISTFMSLQNIANFVEFLYHIAYFHSLLFQQNKQFCHYVPPYLSAYDNVCNAESTFLLK